MKAASSPQKLRGGYYTPPFVAGCLAGWAVRHAGDRVLEPSSGDGEVLAAAGLALRRLGGQDRGAAGRLVGCELDRGEAARCRARLAALGLGGEILEGDFFSRFDRLAAAGPFDAVVGNPPFIRYQTFPEAHREGAFAIMRRAGLRPTRLTNAWVAFVVASTLLLNDRGRLAMVIPAELLQVGYAAELRRFLAGAFGRIVLFTFRRRIFDVQQEVVLLCAEKEPRRGRGGIHVVEVDDPADLPALRPPRAGDRALDHGAEKWTRYFLSRAELELVRRLESDPRIPRLGALAEVDVGVVTGMNEVFVVGREQARRHGAGARWTVPVVTRSAQLAGLSFARGDWEALDAGGAAVRLLRLGGAARGRLPRALRAYLRAAEARGLHQGYKCRIREPWWAVPSIWIPDAFLLRQIHAFPKLVLNGAGATSTDTVHRVRFRPGVDGASACAAGLTSLTLAFSELLGRSYGGGVLELEPREAEALPVAWAPGLRLDAAAADARLRRGEVEAALDAIDAALLVDRLGLAPADVAALRGIWARLRDRRHGRRARAALPAREAAPSVA